MLIELNPRQEEMVEHLQKEYNGGAPFTRMFRSGDRNTPNAVILIGQNSHRPDLPPYTVYTMQVCGKTTFVHSGDL